LSVALRRLHNHLEPGGMFVADNEVPYAQTWLWKYHLKEERSVLPRPWRDKGERRRLVDGSEIELMSRVLEVDPLAQSATMETRALHWRGDELVAEEQHTLVTTLHTTREIVLELEAAGFVDIEVRGALSDRSPTADDDFVVFVARKPLASSALAS
jgi:hypothetical protein